MNPLSAIALRCLTVLAFTTATCVMAAKPAKQPPPAPQPPAPPAAPLPPPPAGTAEGTFSRRIERGLLGSLPFVSRNKPVSESVTLVYAGAFVNKEDDRKPTLLVLADTKLGVGNWKGESDLKNALGSFNGVVFWLDQQGKVFRTDSCWGGQSKSTSGVFQLTLDSKEDGKDLSGSAKTVEWTTLMPQVLKARFHAVVR